MILDFTGILHKKGPANENDSKIHMYNLIFFFLSYRFIRLLFNTRMYAQ